ncbi:MAG: DUF4965 domain-containing protein [Bacteroidaceae bacterium]|nr:DUF4965 domain-containing protein [Bacteroidaceae bacterium]
MKKSHLAALAVILSLTACAQKADFFKPYQATDLRLPSVPLVVSDPYFSIWSPYDQLTDGTTRHWTDDEKSIEGLLRVDGTTYRWMGAERQVMESIVPMADEEAWRGQFTRETPKGNWIAPEFDDSQWQTRQAAFGSPDLSFVRTRWSDTNSDIYVRRTIELTADDLKGDIWLVFSHDDTFAIWFNGENIYDTGNVEIWREGVKLQLTEAQKRSLHVGKNVIAAHCHNTTGGAYLDFGLFRNIGLDTRAIQTASQKSVDVLATSSYYTFACGPVELDVVFTAPMLIDDYDLLSSPANYISYQVRSTDGKEHNTQLLISTTPQLALNKMAQPTVSETVSKGSVKYVKAGTIEQPILAKTGDGICIDWGYLYIPDYNGSVCLGTEQDVKQAFLSSGSLPESQEKVMSRMPSQMPALAYLHDFGSVSKASSHMLIGYDEIWDIQYMYKNYKAYWAHDGNVSIFDMMERLEREYASIMERCQALDRQIYDDGLASGGVQYAEILSGSYRHVIAAHKLFKDDEGNLLFFSKENNSNGCVNTVDLTYPEAPLFLCYNPELQKAMMTSIFDYSLSGRWTKPFAAHDLGTYPKANGQVYGGDMPLEEAGNMLTLAAMLCMLDGNTQYVDKYWEIITTWANYLVENGQDPANQLCTDDFAGHWAHNTNLSVKAIMGVTGYAIMAQMKGLDKVAEEYMGIAKKMGAIWENNAREGDHYRLAFDRSDTWSQKYNMIWDKLWDTGIFPNDAMEREVKYYLTKQNKYGLPLDCRKDYTKSDWIMWTAGMASDMSQFGKFVAPLYTYINETPSRVPISDWSDTKTARMVGFKARSVIGGYWMRVLVDKLVPQAESAKKSKK